MFPLNNDWEIFTNNFGTLTPYFWSQKTFFTTFLIKISCHLIKTFELKHKKEEEGRISAVNVMLSPKLDNLIDKRSRGSFGMNKKRDKNQQHRHYICNHG